MPGLTDAFSVVDISFAIDGVGAFSAANKGWGLVGLLSRPPMRVLGQNCKKKNQF